MIATTIPEALHICPGCRDVAAGELYCEACRHTATFYDNLLTKTGYRAVGQVASIEELDDARDGDGGLIRGMIAGLLLEAWAVAMGFGVHFIWHHWK